MSDQIPKLKDLPAFKNMPGKYILLIVLLLAIVIAGGFWLIAIL